MLLRVMFVWSDRRFVEPHLVSTPYPCRQESALSQIRLLIFFAFFCCSQRSSEHGLRTFAGRASLIEPRIDRYHA